MPRHLGDLSLVKDDTAYELDIIMDHVPGDFISSSLPVVVIDGLIPLDRHEIMGNAEVAVEIGGGNFDSLVLGEPAGGRLHDGKGLGKDFVKFLLDRLVLFLHKLVRLRRQGLLFIDGDVSLHNGPDLVYTFLERGLDLTQAGLEGFRSRP